ncbi:5-formyltetrahydrofolate cyclo-ligase [Algoriphagus winogradskyi]|uniref:5-formyltetrahydrofolate cyclo-ligase n=1 Tax=Algoriphagus winogradskyi TaxID=237017 RepID=A0ABY1PIQ4_9BACT|nr:5-formyltetrahydrofolate cyclo-ligase [Algoriphagus winogradskyi]SMP35032.1 5-formyltetrahydrofolate cyclo-ligase [Algoriphagus winogradskyi]
MSLDKHQLRTFYKELRAALTNEEIEQKSLQISNNVIDFLKERKGLNHIHLFFPIPKQLEVNTYPIKEYIQERGGTVYTSKVDPGSLKLQTLLLKSGTNFQLDSWGIPIPEEYEFASNEMIQLVFVPLLVYDQKGNRIGFGKGYYDVFLASLYPSVIKVGLSFFSPELSIPSELHDIPLDYCITPENIITF